MLKKSILISLLFTTLFLLTSCWGKADINQLAIASAIGVDYTEEGQYRVTAQVVNTPTLREGQGGNQAGVIVYSEEGETVFEALRKLTTLYANRLFIAHFQLLVYGERMAKEGILPATMMFFTDHESRHKYLFLVVKENTAESFLKVQTPSAKIPALEFIQSMETAQKSYGISTNIYTDELIATIKGDEGNIALTSVEIIGDPNKGSENKNLEETEVPTKLKVSYLAVFKKDKLLGYFTEDQSVGYNHIMNNIQNIVVPANFGEDDKVSFEVRGSKVKTKIKIVNQLPVVTISHDVEGVVATVLSGKSDLTKEEIKEIEKNVAEEIKKTMEDSLQVAQHEFNSDIFGFATLLHKKEPEYWKTVKDQYDEIFPQIKVEISVKVLIRSKSF